MSTRAPRSSTLGSRDRTFIAGAVLVVAMLGIAAHVTISVIVGGKLRAGDASLIESVSTFRKEVLSSRAEDGAAMKDFESAVASQLAELHGELKALAAIQRK